MAADGLIPAKELASKAKPCFAGEIDTIKLRSSLTLFALAVPMEPIFDRALARWFGGQRDLLTLRLATDATKNS